MGESERGRRRGNRKRDRARDKDIQAEGMELQVDTTVFGCYRSRHPPADSWSSPNNESWLITARRERLAIK